MDVSEVLRNNLRAFLLQSDHERRNFALSKNKERGFVHSDNEFYRFSKTASEIVDRRRAEKTADFQLSGVGFYAREYALLAYQSLG